MQPFSCVDAIAAPLPIENVDTDKILPGQFLKTITRAGLGKVLFWTLRQDPAFVLNSAPWDTAKILIALDNFGCGSSREHAPWALLDFGITCVIAPQIADIFYNNCFKNGILPVILPPEAVSHLLTLATNPVTAQLRVDLPSQTVTASDGSIYHFTIDPARKADLLAGVDEIARALDRTDAIAAFEVQQAAFAPWIGDTGLALQTSLP